jgi:hypothetical protein
MISEDAAKDVIGKDLAIYLINTNSAKFII